MSGGADASIIDQKGAFALYLAALKANAPIIKALLAAEIDIDTFSDNSNAGTASFAAACGGHKEIVRLLLVSGADTSKRPAKGFHPLAGAATKNHIDIMNMLLDSGADVNAIGCSFGLTALHRAAQDNQYEAVMVLIERGAFVDQQDFDGRSALHLTAHEGIVKVLVAAGADIDKKDNDLNTPLLLACHEGLHKCVWTLICAGADISVKDRKGLSALHTSAQQGHTECVEVLLSSGADANVRAPHKGTPLFSAALYGDAKSVHLMIDAGSNPNSLDVVGRSALFGAKKLENVKALLERGASAKILSTDGLSVLHHAAYHGCDVGILRALFRAGADPTLVRMGKTAADIAREKGHVDAAKMLDLLAVKYRANGGSAMPVN